MDVLILTVFVSLVLVVAAVIFLAKRVHDGDFEHGDRLSLMPLADDEGAADPGAAETAEPASAQAASTPDSQPR